ncbi:hypothetical protein BLL37_20115 [Pseudomonas azotoformans]|uniref:Uncharacterized protein n=1 Tax=Pseudomonas azotoformans TaxID=47878 RepID=A0A1V2JBN1_PSEAZ|nr:hypothetical protein BFL39_02235 [Pseudomonas azotoformans]ONH42792.1 hypothetical protein BLL37_20115 [Pseudomonas azotoformans]
MLLVAGAELLLKGQPLVLFGLLLLLGCPGLCRRQTFNLRPVSPRLHLPDNSHQHAYAKHT